MGLGRALRRIPTTILTSRASIPLWCERRKYLDVAFGPEKSKKYIPDEMIAVWHPQYDKQEDPAKVGKQKHIEYLINNAGPAPKFNNSGGGPRIKMHKCEF